MTQVLKSPATFSSDLGRNIPCLSVRHYEASPPANLSSQLVDADNANASTKEEEWITKKKVELTTKKQIETRVKRQVVLEDGKVVEDSGPIVTTNTTEDTEKQEHEHTEHRHLGDDENDEGWVAVPGTNGTIKEVRENKVRSREEKEETLETEDVQHLGDITDDAYKKAIQSNRKDIRLALRQASRDNNKELTSYYNSTAPRIVSHTTKSRKTVDTEDTKHLTGVQKDGKLITETTKTTEHEEINDTEEPDNKNDEEEEYETHQTSSQKFRKTKDQEFVEYLADGVKIGEEIRYEAENVEGDRKGNPENLRMDPIKWESLSEKIRRMRIEKQKQEEAERMDALTKKPLNFDQEEQTRKVETSKWLEHHFGSESRSSKSSLDDEDSPSRKSKTSTSFINVTMKSAPLGAARDNLTNGKTPESGRSKLIGNGNTGSANSHFKGISEWRDKTRSPSPIRRGPSTEYIIKPKIERSVSMSNHTSGSSRTGLIGSSANRKKQQATSTSDNERSYSPFQPIREKLQTSSSSSSRYHHHLERAESSPLPPQMPSGELESSPLYASVQQRLNNTSDKSSAASYDMTENYYRHERSRADGGYRTNGAKIKEEEDDQIAQQYAQPMKKSNLVKKESTNRRKWSLRREDDILEEEPSPDYSPRATRPRKAPSTPDIRISSATPPPNGEGGSNRSAKRIYQKTRFSAEMPLVVNRNSENGIKRTSANVPSKKNKQQSSGGGLGETFRKLVGKFRSGSGDRKSKKNSKSPSDVGGNVRQQNGYHQSSYQSFNNVDNGIASDATVGAAENRKPVSKSDSERSRNTTTSPSVSRRSYNSGSGNGVGNGIASNVGTQTLNGNYRQSRKKKTDEETMQQSNRQTPTQKYYLGEDPFGRSIYGKEKEYDGTAFFRRRYKNSNSTSTDEERKGIIRNHTSNDGNNVLGSRLSKSTSRLASENAVSNGSRNRPPVDYSRGGIQTLPRKLREDKSIKKQVFINDPSSDQETIHSRRLHRSGNNSSSMINVSVVNNVNSADDSGGFNSGPAKPARTYRTSLLRSKSFNVQPGYRVPEKNVYVSNPQLHRLEESPPPLKSPGIVTSINRSTKDLSKLPDDNFFSYSSIPNGYGSSDDNRRRQPISSGGRTSDPFGVAKTIYHHRTDGNDEGFAHKRLSAATSTPIKNNVSVTPRQKSVQYSSSFHSGNSNYTPRKPTVSFDSSANSGGSGRHSPALNGSSTYTISRRSPEKTGNGEVTTNKTITRTGGSNDDYSETVRITSKSNDPLRPSITNTVQSFSKKTVPVRDGRLKTIESSETTRVTKSHYRAANSDSDGGNGKTKNHYNSKNGSVVIEVRNGSK